MPTVVFRVENDRGEGPYCYSSYDCSSLFYGEIVPMFVRHKKAANTPNPTDEDPNFRRGDFPNEARFAFVDMESLRNWFSEEELQTISKFGLRIVSKQTEEIFWIGNSGQCLFWPDEEFK